jgi:AraC-like DNA-binding protein
MSAHFFGREHLEKIAIKAKFQPARMAAIRRVSQKQQQRQFKAAFEQTPTEWLRQLRCMLGLEHLKKGYSNKATAKELHYASEAHFCRDFKKVHSQSPRKAVRSVLGI